MPRADTDVQITDAVIQISELSRKFGDLTAVDAVTLTINQGEIFGLIGPNGASKSTLICMLTTLLPPTSKPPALRAMTSSLAGQHAPPDRLRAAVTFGRQLVDRL